MKVKLDYGAYMPERAHSTDAGLDIKCPDTYKFIRIGAGLSIVINTGVHVELPENTAGVLISKSGMNINFGITSTGLIDQGYTGEIKVKLYNHSDSDYYIYPGDKISQLVIVPVLYEPIELAEDLDESERGEAGFGSTGK